VAVRGWRRPFRGLRGQLRFRIFSRRSGALVGFTWPSRRLGGAPSGARVAGRGYFPAPPWAFRRRRLAFGVFRGLRSFDVRRHLRVGLRGLRSRSKLLFRPGRISPTFLSWASSRRARPLRASRASISPSSTWLPESTPARLCSLASAKEEPPLSRVPPSWFCTTSAASSSGRSRACCVPLPILGFTAFLSSCDSFRAPKSSTRPVRSPSPRCAFIPLEGSSSAAAASRHRDRCLPGVRSSAFANDVTFEALLRSRVCDVPLPLPAVPRPVLPGLRSPSRSSRLRFRPAPVTPKRSFSLVSIPPGVRGAAGRSLHRGAPGVCPEPKFASPKRCVPSWGS